MFNATTDEAKRKLPDNRPSDESQAFYERARGGKFYHLEKCSDDELELIAHQAYEALADFARFPDTQEARQEIAAASQYAWDVLNSRRRSRNEQREAQRLRQGAAITFGLSVKEFADRMRKTPFDASIMLPEVYVPADELAARAATDSELIKMEGEAQCYADRDRREIAVIGEALAMLNLFDPDLLKSAKADLEKRRANRRKSLKAQEESLAALRAEKDRRIAKYIETEKAKASLPDDVQELKAKVMELEQKQAARG